MKKLLLLTIVSTLSMGIWAADKETVEYCKHKYEQVTMDMAYEQAGCSFNKETKEHIQQNLKNTYLNCADHLDENERFQIAKQSSDLSNIMINKLGKEKACNGNASLYPKQIYN